MIEERIHTPKRKRKRNPKKRITKTDTISPLLLVLSIEYIYMILVEQMMKRD
jgi:hypothetical protein